MDEETIKKILPDKRLPTSEAVVKLLDGVVVNQTVEVVETAMGMLTPSMPGVAHVLQDGHVVPLVDLPPQSLTRKVSSFPSKTTDN